MLHSPGMTGRHARHLKIVVGSSALEGMPVTAKSATDHVCYIASNNNVWRLVSVSLTTQIRQLLQVWFYFFLFYDSLPSSSFVSVSLTTLRQLLLLSFFLSSFLSSSLPLLSASQFPTMSGVSSRSHSQLK